MTEEKEKPKPDISRMRMRIQDKQRLGKIVEYIILGAAIICMGIGIATW